MTPLTAIKNEKPVEASMAIQDYHHIRMIIASICTDDQRLLCWYRRHGGGHPPAVAAWFH